MNDSDGDLMRHSLAAAGEESDERGAARRKARFEASTAKLETNPGERNRIDSIAAAVGITGDTGPSAVSTIRPKHDRAGAGRAGTVTGGLVEIDAQWALHGENADSMGYHVLACTKGALSRANFVDALSRFHLGTVDSLPQVSVSHARLGDQPDEGYLALAIHEFAAGGRRAVRDRQGRPITYTSYFCLPYRPLAERAIGYQSLYEALRAVTLPETDGPPLRVTITAPASRILIIDPLAMRVAALLLTGRPVCVLGADSTSTDERLRFIDTVMGFLPYGLRASMAAATWTRATHGSHKFRLFFSSAPRLGSQPDHVVTWGEPDRVAIPDGPPAEYLGWLEETVAPLARLTEATPEMRFGTKDVLQVLKLALSGGAGLSPALTGPAAERGDPNQAEQIPRGHTDATGAREEAARLRRFGLNPDESTARG